MVVAMASKSIGQKMEWRGYGDKSRIMMAMAIVAIITMVMAMGMGMVLEFSEVV